MVSLAPSSASVLRLQINLISSFPWYSLCSCGLCFPISLICNFHPATLLLFLGCWHVQHLAIQTGNSWKGGIMWLSPPYPLCFHCQYRTNPWTRGIFNSAINGQIDDRWQSPPRALFSWCPCYVPAIHLLKRYLQVTHLPEDEVFAVAFSMIVSIQQTGWIYVYALDREGRSRYICVLVMSPGFQDQTFGPLGLMGCISFQIHQGSVSAIAVRFKHFFPPKCCCLQSLMFVLWW